MNSTNWRFVWTSALALFLAAALQPLFLKLQIGPARPNLLLTVMLCCALLSNRSAGAVLGFAAGLTLGALTNRSITAFAASSALAGFLAGWMPSLVMRDHVLTAVFVVMGGTILAETVFLVVQPGDLRILQWMLMIVTKAAYNGVVAIPVYALLRRFIPPMQN